VTSGPDYLPDLLEMEGSWEDILNRLYSVFSRDFKGDQVKHREIIVLYDRRILTDGQEKEEGFWHVVSIWDRLHRQRLIDYRRAERLPWARPLMESPERMEIRVFDHFEGPRDKGIRRYIWLEDYDYVLILQRRKKAFFWITAFYMDVEWKRKDLRKRFAESTQ
jgi:hypothetical protein